MLSDRQKAILFETKIVSKPRYVRVPLQMYKGVRELKTDVYFPRLLQQYKQNIELMQRLLPDERICHLRADVHGIKDWQRAYERFTCAFRSLNASRIIRRMHITGFRIVDVVGAEKPYVMRSDTFVYGVDSACVVLDSLLRSLGFRRITTTRVSRPNIKENGPVRRKFTDGSRIFLGFLCRTPRLPPDQNPADFALAQGCHRDFCFRSPDLSLPRMRYFDRHDLRVGIIALSACNFRTYCRYRGR